MKLNFIIPGNIDTPTGGYRYDREILFHWQKTNVDVELISLNGSFPFPDKNERYENRSRIEMFRDADIALVDGLAASAMAEFMKTLSQKYTTAVLLHHPLCLENGLSEEQAEMLKKEEQETLSTTSHVVTTSPATAKTVVELFDYPASQISTVLPGVYRGSRTNTSENRDTLNLLCVGSVIERKGHKFLIEALSTLKHLDWHLVCIGMTTLDPALFASLEAALETHELKSRISFHGSVDEETIERFYATADIFVLPSLYEGYGMAYAEAIVRGIPVIGTKAGAIPDTVPPSCGLLVEPGNTSRLRDALAHMISDKQAREAFKRATITAEPSFPTWANSADEFSEILRKLL